MSETDLPSETAFSVEMNASTALRTIFFHVTKACNLSCDYCYFSAKKRLPDELTTDQILRIWPEVAAISPSKLVITGGEPLVRRDIPQLLAGLRDADNDNSILRCLNTNGHLVTKALARELVGLADEVRVSVDALAERNDALRGPGNHQAAMRALETFCDVGFEPKALITVTRQSVEDLEELLCDLFERGVRHININSFRALGRGRDRADLFVDRKTIDQAVARARQRCGSESDEPSSNAAEEQGAPCRNCGVGQFLNIMPNGDVFPCHALTDARFRLGNTRGQSLLEICRANGLLGELAELNYPKLAADHASLRPLAKRPTCLGAIIADRSAFSDLRPYLPNLSTFLAMKL